METAFNGQNPLGQCYDSHSVTVTLQSCLFDVFSTKAVVAPYKEWSLRSAVTPQSQHESTQDHRTLPVGTLNCIADFIIITRGQGVIVQARMKGRVGWFSVYLPVMEIMEERL